MTVKTHAVKPRYRGFRPFFGFTNDDGTHEAGIGFVTYKQNDDGEETYQISKLELGVRSDHITDAIDNMQGNEVAERLVSEASERDAALVGTVKQNAAARKEQAKAANNNGKSDDAPTLSAVA